MKRIKSALELAKIATPTTPDADHTVVYPKSDGLLYYKNSDGVETVLGAGNYQGCFENGLTTSSHYTSRASNSVFNLANPTKFTVRVRFRPSAVNSNHGLATRSALGGAQGDWALGFFNGATMKPGFRVNNNGGSITSASAALNIGQWYFLEASYDSSLASNNLKLFIDGTLDTQGNYTTAVTNNATALIVGTYFDATHAMVGQVSEFDFAAAVVRNTAGYTPPSTLTVDANTTALWKWAAGGAGVDSSVNALSPSETGTTFVTPVYRKIA